MVFNFHILYTMNSKLLIILNVIFINGKFLLLKYLLKTITLTFFLQAK